MKDRISNVTPWLGCSARMLPSNGETGCLKCSSSFYAVTAAAMVAATAAAGGGCRRFAEHEGLIVLTARSASRRGKGAAPYFWYCCVVSLPSGATATTSHTFHCYCAPRSRRCATKCTKSDLSTYIPATERKLHRDAVKINNKRSFRYAKYLFWAT